MGAGITYGVPMVFKTQYRRYCLRKARQRLLKKAGEYLLPGINTILALKQMAEIHAELMRVTEELKDVDK